MKRHHTCLPNRQINKLIFAVFVSFMVISSSALADTVIYVDSSAPPNGSGSSWATAYRFLQDAIAHANDLAPERAEIHVAQGTYRPDESEANPNGTGDREASFTLSGEMSLRGGYLGHKYAGMGMPDPNEQDPNLYETILSGDLAGDDIDVNDLSMLMDEPTRSENSRHVMVVSGWRPPLRGGVYTQDYIWSNANVIEGVTITGGHAMGGTEKNSSEGGGIYIKTGYISINDCLFKNNTAEQGGGVYLHDTTNVRIVSSKLCRNAATYGGGIRGSGFLTFLRSGIILDGAITELIECQLSDNWASSVGGGISAVFSKILLIRCRLTNNVALGGGGLAFGPGHVEFIDTVLKGNIAGLQGGAIMGAIIIPLNFPAEFEFGSLLVSGCDLIANSSEGGGSPIRKDGGGAIYISEIRNVELANCLFVGNKARQYGGVLSYIHSEYISIINCTAQGNRAAFGTFISQIEPHSGPLSYVSIENCIIDNGRDEIWLGPAPGLNSFVEIRYSDLTSGRIPASNDPDSNIIWGLGNLCVDPCFVAPGYWDENNLSNDPNDDFFVPGDYHLKSQAGRWNTTSKTWIIDEVTSPCIDAGDQVSPIGDESFPHGDRINMGAYGGTVEASISFLNDFPPEPNCTNVTDDQVKDDEDGSVGGGGR